MVQPHKDGAGTCAPKLHKGHSNGDSCAQLQQPQHTVPVGKPAGSPILFPVLRMEKRLEGGRA